MFAYLAAGAVALIGWALYDANKPKASTTPLQNVLDSQPYQVGQKVRVPINQLPVNFLPETTATTFKTAGATSLIVQVSGVSPGYVSGYLLSTEGPNGAIMMPSPLPVKVPTAIISGTV